MNAGSIARRYAKALLSIGAEMRMAEKFGKEIESFAELLIGSKDLLSVFSNPTYAHSKRKALMEELVARLRPSNTVRNFLLLLTDRDRVSIVPDVAREYGVMEDELAGRIRAGVTSARPLKADEVSKIEKALHEQTKKKVVLTQATDDQLIAGTVTKIGSVIFDGSVRTRLEDMRSALLEGH